MGGLLNESHSFRSFFFIASEMRFILLYKSRYKQNESSPLCCDHHRFCFSGSCFPLTPISGSSRTLAALLQPLLTVTGSENKESICSSVFFARGNMHFLGKGENKKSYLEYGSFGDTGYICSANPAASHQLLPVWLCL